VPWMPALNIGACSRVVVVVVLRIGLELGGHDGKRYRFKNGSVGKDPCRLSIMNRYCVTSVYLLITSIGSGKITRGLKLHH